MLQEMSIENLGVISRARVEFSPGLTAITGETGAGKTMILSGLGLLMGGKADSQVVRTGSDAAVVEGRVLADSATLAARVDDAGAALDEDGSLLIVRTVAAQGRSRTHLGGRAVPQAVLADLAEDLVTIHGQSDQMRLRSPQRQREALDAFAGETVAGPLRSYRALWNERAAKAAELTDLVERAEERAREAEYLRVGLAEVDRVQPLPGEDKDLAQEAERLSNSEELRASAQNALLTVAGNDLGDVAVDSSANAVELVDRAKRLAEHGGQFDTQLAGLASSLGEIGYALSDVATELSGYLAALDADPARLEAVEARRAALGHLNRSYGADTDAVLAWASAAGLRLAELDDSGDRIADLRTALASLDVRLRNEAEALTAARTVAAAALAESVTEELTGLAMAGATLVIEIDPIGNLVPPDDLVPLDGLGPWGADMVQMLLSAHRGGPPRPLGKGASGGELSRVMLAIEVALATADASGARRTPTMVFDEVDAGVGGKAALEVGRRLARLARTTQVIVVTHLAQVAAFADVQLVVSKGALPDEGDSITQSGIRVVQEAERVAELARMLSGQEDSKVALSHATELLELAAVRS